MTKKRTLELKDLPEGTLPYTMRNDYMFRAVFQKNQNALKGLIYALLSLPEGSITSVVIQNPIILGDAINNKTCVLDLKVALNNIIIINIEMQVNNLGNWPERSLTYLCRSFDSLHKGQDYGEIPATIHISILDFHLSHLTPEFYSKFMMTNIKNHEIYSSKFVLYVLDLTMIEDSSLRKEYGELYDWAVLFKATDWRDLKMLAAKNPYIEDTIFTLHEMTEDEKIREQCEAREKYNWDMAAATAKGKKEGQDLKLISQICRKLQKGKNIDTIAEELEENREIIAKICETAKAFAPEYNVQKIYDTLDTINE